MIFGNPVRGTIHSAVWGRPAGNLDFKLTQDFGPTSVTAEPAVSWAGGEGIPAGYYVHFHRGDDFGNGHCGADILAAAAGTVTYSAAYGTGTNPSQDIVINHGGGWYTSYSHMSTRLVAKGASVSRGQKIAVVGDAGNSTACHLHFGVKSNVPDGANYFSNLVGKMRDPWPRLEQNVTVVIRGPGINIRATAGSGTTPGPLFASTKVDGLIHRTSDNASLGPFSQQHAWGGTVTGASYTVGGVAGDTWEKIYLDSDWRFVASSLAMLSAS